MDINFWINQQYVCLVAAGWDCNKRGRARSMNAAGRDVNNDGRSTSAALQVVPSFNIQFNELIIKQLPISFANSSSIPQIDPVPFIIEAIWCVAIIPSNLVSFPILTEAMIL